MREPTDNEWAAPHPVAECAVDELLTGAYDLHVHAGPDRNRRRSDALDLAEDYAAAGFAGAVIKDHFQSTAGRAHVVNRMLPQFRCLATITLNSSVGGLNAAAVEAAVDEGAQWVIMPTVSAFRYRTYLGTETTESPWWKSLSLIGPDGRLLDEVHQVLDVIGDRDVVLATGHATPEESLALATEAHRRGMTRIVVTHASFDFISMPVEIQRRIVSLGGLIEHVYVSCLYRTPTPLARIWAEMKEVGLASCYLASDLGQVHNPPPLQGWRAAVGGLVALGASDADVTQLIATTPRSLTNDLPRFSGTWHPDDWTPTLRDAR